MWLVISLLELWLLAPSNLWLLGSLLLGHFGHLLLTPVVQSLKKGLLSVSGGRSAMQTKTKIKYIK
jgi:hypothetical protein